ncbi:MAG: C69 family dipeptidase [Promethearchaeota archaeon]|jgi:secernin
MCDTYVCLGTNSKDGNVIFGKNSDRLSDEVQLITHKPRSRHSEGEEVNCTHIKIPQITETAEILMSQPYWMFGCEMGCNEYNVAIGNEAIVTREPVKKTGLLGMDLIRLGLERGKTAKEALEIIIDLLEIHGQGGWHNLKGSNYSNSFIIADPEESYVLEAAGEWWVVEVVKGYRSISNHISIRGKGNIRKEGIIQHAIDNGYCKDEYDFDFKMTFSNVTLPEKWSINSRDGCSLNQLSTNEGEITPALMMKFLREHSVGICMHGRSGRSVGSQVSYLRKDQKSVHWFTGSTIPCLGIFKPYSFPYKGKNAIEPGPYTEMNPDWYWTRHDKYIKNIAKKPKEENPERNFYYKKLELIETEILERVDNIISKENISNNDFNAKLVEINNYSWEQAEEMIK